jgi:hypothetical protein
MLDPDPDPDEMNADPQPCFCSCNIDNEWRPLADDRGIGIVRGQILNFASTRTIYNGGYKATTAISQSINRRCRGSIFLFGPGPDDFLKKAKIYTILTGTEHRKCLKSY